MRAVRRHQIGLATVAVLVLVALVEAVRADHDELAALLGVVMAIVVSLAMSFVHRPAVVLRVDLARWVIDVAVATGEPPERLLDRAVSAYRTGLGGGAGDRGSDER